MSASPRRAVVEFVVGEHRTDQMAGHAETKCALFIGHRTMTMFTASQRVCKLNSVCGDVGGTRSNGENSGEKFKIVERTLLRTVSSGNADHYKWGEDCDGWHLVETDRLSVIQERVPSGAGEVRHYHERAEQFFFVLSGTATIEAEGKTQTLSAQTGLHVPAGTVHEVRNEHKEDLWFLVVSTPPSHGDRIMS